MKQITWLSTLLLGTALLLAGCGDREGAKDGDAAKMAAAPDGAAAAPSEPALPVDEFPGLVPELRKKVRQASLRTEVTVDEGIPFYRITVDIDAEFMTYTGSCDLWVKNNSKKEWKELVFHMFPNTRPISRDLKSLKVTAARIGLDTVEGRDDGARYVLPLPAPLKPGEELHAALDFKGLVKRWPPRGEDPTRDMIDQLSIFFGGDTGDYGIFAYSSGVVTMALWYPVLAAFDEEGWDMGGGDPALGDFSFFTVADYKVSVGMDRGFTIVASGTKVGEEGDRVEFSAGAVREFALIAGTKLTALSKQAGDREGVAINSYGFGGDGDTQSRVLEAAAASVDIFEKLFGEYPYRELDVVRVDLGAGIGGVEFPGMVTIASMLYLDEMKDTIPEAAAVLDSRFMRESIDFVVAHEVAHQWWNAVVGSHSRKHPFVDEALANYSAILYFDKRYGKPAMNRQILFQLKLAYQLNRLLGGEDKVVDAPTDAFDDMIQYSAIVYGKGALFLHELRRTLGDRAFLKAISGYYGEYLFKEATPTNLVDAFAAEAGGKEKKVRRLATHWLHETHGDEDIGHLDPITLFPKLLKELEVELDSWALDLLKEDAAWELVKLGVNVVKGKDDYFEGVRLDIIMEWGTKMAKKLMFELISMDSLF